jgi:hypothetical protein
LRTEEDSWSSSVEERDSEVAEYYSDESNNEMSSELTFISDTVYMEWQTDTSDIVDYEATFRPRPVKQGMDLYPFLSPFQFGNSFLNGAAPELLQVFKSSNDCWSIAMLQLMLETKGIVHDLNTGIRTKSSSTGRRVCRYCRHRQARRRFTACTSCLPRFESGICLPLAKFAGRLDDKDHQEVLCCFQQHILEAEEAKFREIIVDPLKRQMASFHFSASKMSSWQKLLPPSPRQIMMPHHLQRLVVIADEDMGYALDVRARGARLTCKYCFRRTYYFCSSCHLRSRSEPVPICLPWQGKYSCYNRHIHEDFEKHWDLGRDNYLKESE